MRKLVIVDCLVILLHLMVEEKPVKQMILACRQKEDFLRDYGFLLLLLHFLTCCDHLVEVIKNFFVGLINYYDTFGELLEHLQ